jgi:lipopolysaccharide transport system ATP-binding protein
MSEPVISVEKLSKRYILGHQRSQGNGLRHVIEDAMRSPLKWLRARREQKREEFWALKDVSFEVRQGEVLGIIGRNGAGKSTLLKILSRITEPTAGRIEIKGRVASLLEVGTGFHPELTGRENIFLNGAILGMTRGEIRRKFDEIVAFSEVEKFLDTPVKRYSSGMYVRLAFAVSAHLEPEILIMDEVLAVGDLQFQKKCLGKLQSVSAKEGRTVLFVSHNLGVVANLCSRGLLLRNGMLAEQGNTNRVISQFINDSAAESGQVFWNGDTPPQSDRVAIRAARTVSEQRISADIAIDQPMYLEVEIEVQRSTANLASSIHLFDKQGAWVLCSGTKAQTLEPGRYAHRYHFPANFFNDGRYYFNLILVRDATQIEVNLSEALAFFVHETGVGREEYGGAIGGCIRPHLKVESVPIVQ